MRNGYQSLLSYVEVNIRDIDHLLQGIFAGLLSQHAHSGTHISNTREAKAFALLSEEGIAKGIRRVTAVTLDYAFKAFELASSLEQEINEASKTEGSILEQVL